MFVGYSALPTEQIAVDALPFYFRHNLRFPSLCKDLIRLGAVKRGSNEPYCYTEEKKCAGQICRVLMPSKVIDRCTVIRDDGTVWRILLSSFEEVYRLEVTG